MTDNIQIDTGVRHVTINGNPECFLEFNPNDTLFVERFYKVYREIDAKTKEYRSKKISELEKSKEADDAEKYFAFVKDANSFMREKIDYIFGDGSSQKVFGDFISYDMDIYVQFLEGIGGIVKQARSKKVEKYIPPSQKPVKGARTKPKKPRNRK